ncbi:MAG TPA: hypothetical protein V6C72_03100, partial [Chroococcales cyanobacterium]
MAQADQATSDVRGIEGRSKAGDNQGAANLAIQDYKDFQSHHNSQQTASYWKEVSGQLKADGVLPEISIGYAQANFKALQNDNGNLSRTQLSNYAEGRFQGTGADQLFSQTLLDNYDKLKGADNKDSSDKKSNNSEVTVSDLKSGVQQMHDQSKAQADVTSWLSGKDHGSTLLARVDKDGGKSNTHDGFISQGDIQRALSAHPGDFTDAEKAFLKNQMNTWDKNPVVDHKQGFIDGDSLTAAYNNATGEHKSFKDVLDMSQPHTVKGADDAHPAEIVYPDGSTRSFKYDDKGNISQITESQVGVGSTTFRNDGKGWGPVQPDGSVIPSNSFAPSIDDKGNFTYYSISADGNLMANTQSKDFGGKSFQPGSSNTTESVTLPKGTKIPGVTDDNGNLLVDNPPADPTSNPASAAETPLGKGKETQLGSLNVTSNGDGSFNYTVASGDSLTAIAQQIADAK